MRLARHLGVDAVSQWHIFFVAVWLIRKRSGGRAIERVLRLRKFDRPFSFSVRKSSDLTVLRDVFLYDEYSLSDACDASVIVDLGSNVGASVAYFKLKYPHARVYAVEPDPSSADALRKNSEQFSGVTVLELAISGEDGVGELYIPREQSISSSLVRQEFHNKAQRIKTKNLDTLMAELHIEHIDLLKFDIEGMELDAFRKFKGMGRVKRFIGELHLDLISASKEEFLSLFPDHRVTLRQLSAQRYIVEAVKAY
jgi:FkbM family methyltransferase